MWQEKNEEKKINTNLFGRYSTEEIHKYVPIHEKALEKILKQLSKRKRMGIKKNNGKWSIPGGEVKAIVWMIQKYGENCINN